MSRVWEIIDNSRHYSKRDEELAEAYECGYDAGYGDAMKEVHSQMGERSYRINDQYTGKDSGAWERPSSRREDMGMRYMNERRSRDSQGRYR